MKRVIRWLFGYLKRKIYSSDKLQSLLYDDANVDQFADLEYQEEMLADRGRLDAYHEAIGRAVKPGDVVIDLGTGTGILAMFAARQAARTVYALEHGAIIDIAKRVAAANGLTNIEFIRKNSRDFTPPEPADLVIHEQIGSYLFDENMIENLLDLKARALKPGGKILPARFQFFLEPVSLREDHRVPYCWETPIHGIDYSVLNSDEFDQPYRKSNGRRIMDAGSMDKYACSPEPLIEFDLDSMTDATSIPTTFRVTRTVVQDGRVDGLSVFFRTVFDGDLSFDNALDSPNTNWNNPLFRVPSKTVKKGDQLTISLTMESLLEHKTWKAELH